MNKTFSHKDAKPSKTISNIKKILKELNINLVRKKWVHYIDGCYSVNVRDKRMPFISTNGKGLSKKLALASGYAEFLERLQNVMLIEEKFGLLSKSSFLLKNDQSELTFENIFKNNEEIKKLFGKNDELIFSLQKDTTPIHCEPFYNVFKKKVDYLPIDYIKFACFSNGMCAGNTPEEAICQGICEIFERYASREIFFNNLNVPNISMSDIKHLKIYSKIKKIFKSGYRLIIKDCTLNGMIPVIAVIIIDSKSGFQVSFGSDPIFEIALQRCITELFQGVDFKKNKLFFSKFYHNSHNNLSALDSIDNLKLNDFLNWVRNKRGDFNSSILLSNKNNSKIYKQAFKPEFVDHHETLDFLLSMIKNNNARIHIHDVSFLKFPSYYVYISGMSEIIYLDSELLDSMTKSGHIKKSLLRLKKCSENELNELSIYLENIVKHPYYFHSFNSHSNSKILQIHLRNNNSELVNMHIFNLLALLFYRLRDYTKAYNYLDLYINTIKKNDKNIKNMSAVLMYIKMRKEKLPDDLIRANLIYIFGKTISDNVVMNLKNSEEIFDNLTLLECGNCNDCLLEKECYHREWDEVSNKLIDKINGNPINQGNIGTVFKDL